jgi:hypothetical protein
VREWFNEKKEAWKKFFDAKIEEAKANGLISMSEDIKARNLEPERLKELGFMDKDGNASLHDSGSDNGIAYEDFSSEEEEDPQADMKGIMLSMHDNKRRFGPKSGGTDVGESKYFKAIINKKHRPQYPSEFYETQNYVKDKLGDVYKKYKNNNSDFLNN